MWLLFLVLMCCACAYALASGGRPERAAAMVIVIGSILSPCVADLGPRLWHGFELGIFIVDVGMLIAFGVIMLHSSRFWPIWMTALQLLTVSSYLGPLFRAKHIAIPFAFVEELWSYLILLQLMLVTAIGAHGGIRPLWTRLTGTFSLRRRRKSKPDRP